MIFSYTIKQHHTINRVGFHINANKIDTQEHNFDKKLDSKLYVKITVFVISIN